MNFKNFINLGERKSKESDKARNSDKIRENDIVFQSFILNLHKIYGTEDLEGLVYTMWNIINADAYFKPMSETQKASFLKTYKIVYNLSISPNSGEDTSLSEIFKMTNDGSTLKKTMADFPYSIHQLDIEYKDFATSKTKLVKQVKRGFNSEEKAKNLFNGPMKAALGIIVAVSFALPIVIQSTFQRQNQVDNSNFETSSSEYDNENYGKTEAQLAREELIMDFKDCLIDVVDNNQPDYSKNTSESIDPGKLNVTFTLEDGIISLANVSKPGLPKKASLELVRMYLAIKNDKPLIEIRLNSEYMQELMDDDVLFLKKNSNGEVTGGYIDLDELMKFAREIEK